MKLLRRWWHARRIAHWQAIVASIARTEAEIPLQRAQALTYLSNARDDLRRVDRAPVSKAIGPGRRDGIDRSNTPYSRKVRHLRITSMRGN